MASRLGRSFYRFSTVGRPTPAPTTAPPRDQAQPDSRNLAPTTRYQSVEPISPTRARSPLSPTRESLPTSQSYSAKKAASPPYSPEYKPAAPRTTRFETSTEVEQKPVLDYTTVEKPAKSDRLFGSGKSAHKQPDVIKIAGENIGAVMEITRSPGKSEGGQIIKKKETRGTHNIANENDEALKDKGSHKGKETTSLPTNSFLNSNFQSVNNSLLYNASLTHRDPGLHVAFSKKPGGDGSTMDDKKHVKS